MDTEEESPTSIGENNDQAEPMRLDVESIHISNSNSNDTNDSNDSGNSRYDDGVRRRNSSTDMSEDSDGGVPGGVPGGAGTGGQQPGGMGRTGPGAMEIDDSQEVDATVLKRRAIQAIQRDPSLDEQTKRFRIQQLMDGSSYSGNHNQNHNHSSSSSSSSLRNASLRNTSDFLSATSAGGVTGVTGAGSSSAVRRSSSYGIGIGTGTASTDVMKCLHYEGRKCNIVAPCCNKIFGCRVCHDEMVTDGHEMNRFLVREIVCKECHTRQERSNTCIKCNITFGEYHCNTCNLWMNKTKQPFHCDKCGICRVGGRENFVHCDQCDMCISQTTYDNHMCLKDKFKNSCPICFENMHSSRHAALDLPCGHAIHTHCFRKLAAFDYRCPICKKTVVNPETMPRAWAERAREIESQPMPADLARSVDIWCNDCEEKSEGRDWHFLGVQCPNCKSFNTAVENNVSRRTGSTVGGGGGDGN